MKTPARLPPPDVWRAMALHIAAQNQYSMIQPQSVPNARLTRAFLIARRSEGNVIKIGDHTITIRVEKTKVPTSRSVQAVNENGEIELNLLVTRFGDRVKIYPEPIHEIGPDTARVLSALYAEAARVADELLSRDQDQESESDHE